MVWYDIVWYGAVYGMSPPSRYLPLPPHPLPLVLPLPPPAPLGVCTMFFSQVLAGQTPKGTPAAAAAAAATPAASGAGKSEEAKGDDFLPLKYTAVSVAMFALLS